LQPQGRRLPVIGGLSWESAAEFYRLINQSIRVRLGGLRSTRWLM
jgi:aspartate racemase